TPEQQSQAQQNSRRTQPTPLASNCTLIPGLYSGRWSNGRLEILVTKSNGKATGVNYSIRSVGAMQRPTHLTAAQPSSSTSSAPSNAITELQVSSTPDGADIGIDGDFVGNTPSTVSVAAGEHTITIRLSGYQTWERKIKTSGGAVKVSGT